MQLSQANNLNVERRLGGFRGFCVERRAFICSFNDRCDMKEEIILKEERNFTDADYPCHRGGV